MLIGELQRQIDEITGHQPLQPVKKTIAEMEVEMASLRAKIDTLRKEIQT